MRFVCESNNIRQSRHSDKPNKEVVSGRQRCLRRLQQTRELCGKLAALAYLRRDQIALQAKRRRRGIRSQLINFECWRCRRVLNIHSIQGTAPGDSIFS